MEQILAPLRLPPIYPITPPGLTTEELLEWAKSLLAEGCTLMQFRRKIHSDMQQYLELEALLEEADGFGCRVIVDDRCDLCQVMGAHGVHLGQADIPPKLARQFLGEGEIVGFSTHGRSQARLAFAEPVDYIAIGPVFPTASKENPDDIVPQDAQREVISSSPVPVVAIGGITPDRAPGLWQRGFSSLAVISALVAEPGKGWRKFHSAWERLNPKN